MHGAIKNNIFFEQFWRVHFQGHHYLIYRVYILWYILIGYVLLSLFVSHAFALYFMFNSKFLSLQFSWFRANLFTMNVSITQQNKYRSSRRLRLSSIKGQLSSALNYKIQKWGGFTTLIKLTFSIFTVKTYISNKNSDVKGIERL